MCGIVGYVGRRDCAPIMMEGLARIEYRGYDSAGLAVAAPGGGLRVHKRAGKLERLRAALPKRLAGRAGVSHTRWATHGEPTDANAHPHVDAAGRIAVVHNGIVENVAQLRAELEAAGTVLASETDTECLAHLIAAGLVEGSALEDAVAPCSRGSRARTASRCSMPSSPTASWSPQRLAGHPRHRRARDARGLGRRRVA